MPFLIGEVGGISKHVPTVQKEGRARSGEQLFFGVPHLNFLYSRFTAIRFIVSNFWRERRLRRMYVYMYIYMYTYLLVRVYTYMSLDPSGEGVKLISTMVLYKFGRHFPFPGGWAAFGLNFCYPLAL